MGALGTSPRKALRSAPGFLGVAPRRAAAVPAVFAAPAAAAAILAGRRCSRRRVRRIGRRGASEPRELKTRELRRALEAAGVSTRGCFDRESLLEVLARDGVEELVSKRLAGTPSGAVEIPIHLVRSVDQYGIKADADSYAAVDLAVGPGGIPGRFVLDTGASHTIIREDAAQRFGAQDMDVPVSAQGGTGVQAGGMRLVGLGRASLGTLDCGAVQAVATRGHIPVPPECAGLLGLDFLRRFDWALDVPQRRVLVAPATSGGAAPFDVSGLRLVPLQPLQAASGFELLAVPLRVQRPRGSPGAGARCLAVVDLGAPFSICSQATAAALGLADSELRSTGKVVSGLDGNPMFVREATLLLSVGEGPDGPVELEAEVIVGDLPVFQALGLTSAAPIAILGLDVLGRARCAAALASRRLWLAA